MRITGVVQGVGYRYSCRAAALERGVSGWVRNRPDGSVEAVFRGPRPAVDALLTWCEAGPPAARVTAVEVTDEATAETSSIPGGAFEIR